MSKILIDTNILIYSIDPNSEFNQAAINLLRNEDLVIYITTKNISEYFVVCSKLEIDKDIIWGFYEDLKINSNILFPDANSLNLLEILMKKYKPRGTRVFDVEIVSIMLANNIDTIATFNTDDFKSITEIQLYRI